MPACKHIESMEAYLEDAKVSEAPWKLWESRFSEGGEWLKLSGHPAWSPLREYRRKVERITLGDCEFPEPARTAPKIGSIYYTPDIHGVDKSVELYWSGDRHDSRMLKAGIVHLTKSAAEEHAIALLSVTKLKE